jgi:hypothetical protein
MCVCVKQKRAPALIELPEHSPPFHIDEASVILRLDKCVVCG